MALAFILWALSISLAIGFVWGAIAGASPAFVGFRYEAAADAFAVDSAAEEPHLSRNEPPV